MTVFDTLAMYLMITADWINTMDIKEEDGEVVAKNATTQTITITEKVDLTNIEKELVDLKSKIVPQTVEKFDDSQIINKINDLQSMMKNKPLYDKLTKIEDKISKK